MFRFLRRLALQVLRGVLRLLKNQPNGPYESIFFSAAQAAEQQFRSN